MFTVSGACRATDLFDRGEHAHLIFIGSECGLNAQCMTLCFGRRQKLNQWLAYIGQDAMSALFIFFRTIVYADQLGPWIEGTAWQTARWIDPRNAWCSVGKVLGLGLSFVRHFAGTDSLLWALFDCGAGGLCWLLRAGNGLWSRL